MLKNLCRCGLAVLALLSSGCTPKRLTDPVHHSARRSRQLMVLAAVEARHIPDADVRLTRQLNIANEVLAQYGKDGAVEVLHEATETLNGVGKQLTGHALLAGWVSVAQLARRASAGQLATDASDRAVRELERLPDPAERCDYVMGVAEEVSHAVGAPAAVALLMKSGTWAASILQPETRRSARLAFASALFNLEDYEAGAAVLRQENDPLWSSEAMMRLASPGSYYAFARNEVVNGAVAAQVTNTALSEDAADRAAPAAAAVPRQQYGKQLGFEGVFEGRTTSTASER